MECCTSNIASLHQENPDPPSKNRVGDFEVVTYSCTRVIRPQALEPHQETYTTTTTTVSDVVEWLSKDPIGINGGLNQYVAFGNNPVNFRDWSGLCPDGRYESGEDYVRGYTDALFRDWWWAWAVPTIWAGHKDRDIAVHNEFADYWYRGKVWRSDQMGNIGPGYAFSCLVGPSLSLAICTVAEGVYAIGSRSTMEDAKASIELNHRGNGDSVKDGKANFGMYIISAPSMFFMMQPGR